MTSTLIAANVVTTMAASTHSVDLVWRMRKLYSSANVIQIRWNGMASQRSKITIPARPRIHSSTQARSSQPGQDCQPSLAPPDACAGPKIPAGCQRVACGPAAGCPISLRAARPLRGQPVTRTTHRLNQVEPELGPQPPDADIHDVRSRVEVDAPHGGQQLVLRDRLAGMFHELSQEHYFQPGQRYRAATAVCLQAAEVEH